MQATPSGWQLLLDAAATGGPDSPRCAAVRALRTRSHVNSPPGWASFWNMYRPTEATISPPPPGSRPGTVVLGEPVGAAELVVTSADGTGPR